MHVVVVFACLECANPVKEARLDRDLSFDLLAFFALVELDVS